jgi:hypothetical protein
VGVCGLLLPVHADDCVFWVRVRFCFLDGRVVVVVGTNNFECSSTDEDEWEDVDDDSSADDDDDLEDADGK